MYRFGNQRPSDLNRVIKARVAHVFKGLMRQIVVFKIDTADKG